MSRSRITGRDHDSGEPVIEDAAMVVVLDPITPASLAADRAHDEAAATLREAASTPEWLRDVMAGFPYDDMLD